MGDKTLQFLITKMTNFTPETWPVVSPPYNKPRTEQSKKACINLIKDLTIYDGIIVVASTGEHAPKNKKGKILGIAFCGNTIHHTKDVVHEMHLNDLGVWKDGIGNNFRWPYGVAITEAFVFKPPYLDAREVCDPKKIGYPDIFLKWGRKPLLKKLSLEQSEALNVSFLKIKKQKINLPTLKVPPDSIKINSSLRGTKGPHPLESEGKFKKGLSKKNVTYALQFNKSNCYKIGYTKDLNARLNKINQHIPHEVLGENNLWQLVLHENWYGSDSANSAYDMEQKILNILNDKRTTGEKVQCSKSELESAWIKSLLNSN